MLSLATTAIRNRENAVRPRLHSLLASPILSDAYAINGASILAYFGFPQLSAYEVITVYNKLTPLVERSLLQSPNL